MNLGFVIEEYDASDLSLLRTYQYDDYEEDIILDLLYFHDYSNGTTVLVAST